MGKLQLFRFGYFGITASLAAILYAGTPAHGSANPATRLIFSSPAQKVPLGQCAEIPFVTEDGALQIKPVSATTVVTISGSNKDIALYSDAACTAASSEVMLAAGQDAGTIYFAGSEQGSVVVSLKAPGLNAATQTETITAPAALPCSGPQSPPTMAPAQAAAAGFKNLIFDDEFNSINTISPNNSGTYNWYTWNPYSTSAEMPLSDFQVQNGCLTIETDLSGYSAGLMTINSTTDTAGTFQLGYFEARMQFYPAGSQGGAWPAFWSYALQAIQGTTPYAELDFIEAYPGGAGGATLGSNGVTLLTTVHQWTSSSSSTQQPNDVPALPANFNYDAFHIYGCLWTTDSVTWYIDNQPVMTVATGPGTSFTALEQDQMFLVLGTGKSWPVTFDYVRVWH
jgi:beta-glucanase (GH16 family)